MEQFLTRKNQAVLFTYQAVHFFGIDLLTTKIGSGVIALVLKINRSILTQLVLLDLFMNQKPFHRKERFLKIFTAAIYEAADVLFDAQESTAESPSQKLKRRLRPIPIPTTVQPTDVQMQQAKQIAEYMGLVSMKRNR